MEYFLLMMENLVDSGWQVYSITECPTYEECCEIFKDIAKLHSHYWQDDAKLSTFPV